MRGEAAEYAFGQLPPEALQDFTQLEKALEACYKEKRTSSLYLAELENRKLQPKEKLADYVADMKKLVIKEYPTADAQTREKINVRHFLKGLTDQQMGASVGMREPASIDEVRQILEMYNSLRDEIKIHQFELCNLRMIVISLFQKRGLCLGQKSAQKIV